MVSPHTLRPRGDRVLVRVKPWPERTPRGVWLGAQPTTSWALAEVIAVSAGWRATGGATIPLSVRPGDTVIVSTWGPTPIRAIHPPEYGPQPIAPDQFWLVSERHHIQAIVDAS